MRRPQPLAVLVLAAALTSADALAQEAECVSPPTSLDVADSGTYTGTYSGTYASPLGPVTFTGQLTLRVGASGVTEGTSNGTTVAPGAGSAESSSISGVSRLGALLAGGRGISNLRIDHISCGTIRGTMLPGPGARGPLAGLGGTWTATLQRADESPLVLEANRLMGDQLPRKRP